ncbi:MAG: 4Fe-4S dicluster domain-containing protein [Candidatus Bathyarchaeia archaeon]
MSTKESVKVEIKETLRSSNFDRSFPEEIMRHPGGEKLLSCYQCGSCVGSCPSGKLTDAFNPRRIIKMSLLGLRNKVLSGKSIWLCASCYACQERCPQGVEPADLMLAIRNVAVEEGYVPKLSIDQASALIESGRIAKITRLTEKRRVELDLPSIPPASVEAVRKIVAATGFDKLITKLEAK